MADSPLIPVDEVIRRLVALAQPVQDRLTVTLEHCAGMVLAQDIVAPINVPPAANSAMDGYALNVDDPAVMAGAVLPVSDRIAAGYVGQSLQRGTVARIFTGAPVPVDANAVVMQEDTTQETGNRVRLNTVPHRGESIRPAGQDILQGTRLFTAGRRLRPEDTAVIASVGIQQIEAYRPLRIALMSTGDELVAPPGPLGPGQIFNANHYALMGMIRRLGMQVVDLGLVRDSPVATESALLRGAAEADCIVSTGGVSVGEEDHVKDALIRLGHLELWRIAIKPGKPLAFGKVGDTPFFGLPGNPVSAFVTFTLIARPYLLRFQGCSEILPRPFFANAGFQLAAGSRREYLRVRLEVEAGGSLRAMVHDNQGSGVMSSVSWADALAEVEIGQSVAYGDRLKVYLLD